MLESGEAYAYKQQVNESMTATSERGVWLPISLRAPRVAMRFQKKETLAA